MTLFGPRLQANAAELLRALLAACSEVYLLSHVEDDIGEAAVQVAAERWCA